MALIATHKEIEFGVGDTVRVHQRIFDSASADSKSRVQIFEGMVLSIGGRDMGKSVRLRKMSGTVGVELIFPIHAPVIEKVEVVKRAVEGSTHAKLYYVRTKSKREIDRIYSRVNKKTTPVKPTKASKSK
jgi:large subunit ribosomal protein L19